MEEKEVETLASKIWASQYFKIGLVVLAAMIFYRFLGFFIFALVVAAFVVGMQIYVTSQGGWKKVWEKL